jgi:hypothetical protein
VTALKLIVLGGSAWALLLILFVLVCWRFTPIRPTLESALRERIAEPGFGDDVWAGLDRALAEPGDEPDDIDALVDAINEDHDKAHFEQWENEFRERAS